MTSFSTADATQSKAELFSLSPDQASHIEIYTVVQAPMVRTLRLSGTVAYNAFQTTPVIAQVGGPVSRILVTPGEQVRASQPLLYIASPDYSQLRSAYIKARDAYQLADKIYVRAQDLYAHKAIAQADVEQAESTRAEADADLQSSEQAIRVLGISKPEDLVSNPPSPEVALLAPLAGEVVERLCSPGQVLQSGATQCFTLSNTENVWVLVNIYQNDLAYVHVGDEVTIENEAYPGAVRGKIQFIAPALDPTTRTLPARIEAPNPDRRLKKDMYVTALVRAGAIPGAVMVPDAAVLRDTDNMPYVYLQTGDNQFARRMVTLGETQDGKTQISSGLKAGDKIVGSGGLFLQFQNSLQR
jgi:cobalt-zinc-cadmium efflux system membrane fusion protein